MEAVVGILPVFIFAVIALCAVVGAVNGVIVVDIIPGEFSFAVSEASLVGCGGLGRVGALTVYRAGLLGIVLVVGSVVSGVVVVGCIVVVGGVVDIGGVGGFIVREVVVSRIKPARMLAFSASKSMRCGGKVFAVVSVVSVFVVVGCVVGIGVVVSIIIRRVIVSRIKPARMLAFSSLKSVRCGGTVMGWDGGGVARVGSVGCNGGVVVVGIVVWLIGFGGVIRKSSSKFSSTSVCNFGGGGAVRVGAVAGESSTCNFPVVAVFECVVCVVISGGVVVGVVNFVVGKSCRNRARKFVSSASRSWLSGVGARGGRGGGGVVVLVAAGGGFVVVRLVVVWSRSVWLRPFGIVVWFVFVFFVLV